MPNIKQEKLIKRCAENQNFELWNEQTINLLIDLKDAKLYALCLVGANLKNANLRGAILTSANLSNANLSNADLSGSNLNGAYLIETNLSGADLTGSDLTDINLSGANLKKANATGSWIEHWVIDKDTDLDMLCNHCYTGKDKGLRIRHPSAGNFAPGEFSKWIKEQYLN